MYKIWRPPILHNDTTAARHVTWLELFYDLVYVATIIQMGNQLSQDVSWWGALKFVLLFTPIWGSWTAITFYMNRFVVDDIWHRGLIFLHISAIAALALSVPDAFTELSTQFALSYVAIRLLLIFMYGRAWLNIESARPMITNMLWCSGLIALCWLASAFVPAPNNYLLWVLGILIDLSIFLWPTTRQHLHLAPTDIEHLAERYGLLTIIVLGESFIKIIARDTSLSITWPVFWFSCAGMTVTYSLWWLYFDDVADSTLRTGRPRDLYFWLYAHLPLAIAITAFGVASKKLLFSEMGHALKAEYRWLYGSAIIIYLLAVGLIDQVTQRDSDARPNKWRTILRFITAALVLALIIIGTTFSAPQFVVPIALIFIIQILIDLPWPRQASSK